MRYQVMIERTQTAVIEVEAANKELAEEIALTTISASDFSNTEDNIAEIENLTE